MIAIVVDSTAALTRGEATQLGVTMVGDTYLVGGQPRIETYMGENGNYAADLEAGLITETHTATVDAFRTAFESLLSCGYDVLCITLSSRLAGTYRNACQAADATYQAETSGDTAGTPSSLPARDRIRTPKSLPRVAVLDSLSGFSNTEYLVRRARELEGQGKTFDEIIDDLVQRRTRQGICFSVLDVSSLRASGRLAMVPQSVSTTLNRYPVFLMQDGAITYADSARGISTLARKMVAQVPSDARDLILAHYGSRGPLIVELLKTAKAAIPNAKIRVKDGGPVLSCNLGPGAASIAWGPEDENRSEGKSED